MKKLMLDVESLAVESFEVDALARVRGTVAGADSLPSDGCPATMLLSQCASACMQSGIQACLKTQTCC